MLLGIREIQDSIASLVTTRCVLCVGPPHQYPVPLCGVMKLLRVLDALGIRLYEIPVEVEKHVRLRYLALTFHGQLPPSISKLLNLRFLIAGQHLSIKSSSGDSSYLPMEIWDMKELEHLHITGRDLPNPNQGALLPNLATLLDVSVESITKSVLEGIPNLKRLGVRIELAPDDDSGDSLHFLNLIYSLQELESLKCVVVNPELRVLVPPPRTMLPWSLKKLSLSGVGYPWEYMRIIGKLQNLQVLKLRCQEQSGTRMPAVSRCSSICRWKIWIMREACFQQLEYLSITHCYGLEQHPPYFASTCLQLIQVVDCNSYAETWTRENEKGFRRPTGSKDMYKYSLHSSWNKTAHSRVSHRHSS